MKTYGERTEDVLLKIKKKKMTRRIVRSGVVALLVLVLLVGLFLPFGTEPPSVRRYADSPYYGLIKKLNAARYEPPKYDNLFDTMIGLGSQFRDELIYGSLKGDVTISGVPGAPMDAPAGAVPGENYQEITDNQVEGVIEGDLIKRSNKYIYYLHRDRLGIYPIDGAQTKELGSYHYSFDDKGEVSWYTAENREMYLSEDCTAVTLVLAGFGDVLEAGEKDYFVCVISLDVTDPANIQQTGKIYLTGSYKSSRLVNGKLLLMSRYSIPKEIDYSDPGTYVPRFGEPGNMACIPADSMIMPDELTSTNYTVVTMLDQKTTETVDTAAFLSYTDALYVSADSIFAARSCSEKQQQEDKSIITAMTEIAIMNYSEDGLTIGDCLKIEGTVKNQYSMDAKDGILRVVTSTTETVNAVISGENRIDTATNTTTRNANLYCIQISDGTVLGKVESFAPEGETVESVRFDGDYAYVCTAEVVTLTDPVYFFDLRDLNNITWKDTGTIDGYSSSLLDFGNGNLIGIGFNERRQLKIEAYRETDTGVASVCAYERSATFSTDYKSYYIDRENQIIGLGVYFWGGNERVGCHYVLLHFDGMEFRELAAVPMEGREDELRGVVIDGWLYAFGDKPEVIKVW